MAHASLDELHLRTGKQPATQNREVRTLVESGDMPLGCVVGLERCVTRPRSEGKSKRDSNNTNQYGDFTVTKIHFLGGYLSLRAEKHTHLLQGAGHFRLPSMTDSCFDDFYKELTRSDITKYAV